MRCFGDICLGLWNNLERSCNPTQKPQFYEWFYEYKANDFASSTINAVRKKAGVTSRLYTTNISESINHVLKQEVNWKEQKLPQLIECIVDRQYSEVEMAVIGRGQWQLLDKYSDLIVPEANWFNSMTDETKKRHMKKVFNKELIIDCRAKNSATNFGILDIPYTECNISSISSTTLASMWKKAENLIESLSVIEVPWMNDSKARLVRSSSSDHPHLVTVTCNGLYKCDEKCPMYKGYSLCSHVIAAAQVNCDLKLFLNYYNSKQAVPNLSSIAYADLPTGAGRKGGVPKRKCKAPPLVEMSSTHPSLHGPSLRDVPQTQAVPFCHQVANCQQCRLKPRTLVQVLTTSMFLPR